jgi:capsule biosynthesis phosphatase
MKPNPTKTIVFDVDDTILTTKNRDYENSVPHMDIIEVIRRLKTEGWVILFHTARGMGRSSGNINLVYDEVYQEIETFLLKWDIPYDGIQLGKPWAAYYVDDKALRPDEFLKLFS